MIGVLNVYKEPGCTSFGVVARLRRITGEKKIGHAGTLDPDATGVLPVCLGKATKLVGQLSDTDKEYRASMIFGKRTDTQDLSGEVLEEMEPEAVRRNIGGKDEIIKAIESFTGEIEQLPPMYSAVKVDGVKLVDAARRGKEIERTPRKVRIYEIYDIDISEDLLSARFTVGCSKGTYIRTLCQDIGEKLGVPACMSSLERTKACGLSADTAYRLSEIEKYKDEGRLSEIIIPVDSMLSEHEALTVNKEAVKRLVYGNYMYFKDFAPGQNLGESGVYRIYDERENFYGLYRFDKKDKCYKCEKMFVEQDENAFDQSH